MQDKKARFVRLAEARVRKAIQMIRLIGNLSNKNNYTCSEDDALKILSALDAEMRLLRARFHSSMGKHAKAVFRLK